MKRFMKVPIRMLIICMFVFVEGPTAHVTIENSHTDQERKS